VPVEVVWCEVEYDRDPGVELLDVGQLKARDLADQDVLSTGLAVEAHQRGADVSTRQRPPVGHVQHLGYQPGGRGLAVGAGHRHDGRAFQQPESELQLADDLDARLPDGLKHGRAVGNARACHHQLVGIDVVGDLRGEPNVHAGRL